MQKYELFFSIIQREREREARAFHGSIFRAMLSYSAGKSATLSASGSDKAVVYIRAGMVRARTGFVP